MAVIDAKKKFDTKREYDESIKEVDEMIEDGIEFSKKIGWLPSGLHTFVLGLAFVLNIDKIERVLDKNARLSKDLGRD